MNTILLIKRNKRTDFYRGALSLLLIGILLLVGCGMPGDPIVDDLYTKNVYPGTTNTYNVGSDDYTYNEGWFYNLYATNNLIVGEDTPPLSLLPGSGYFDAALRIRTEHSGMGLVILGHNAVMPLHIGTGSFDLTGGTYENLFTSTTAIFQVEDMERTNWIVISGGEYLGYAAEIITFVDASNVQLHTFNWSADLTAVPFIIVSHPIFASTAAGHVHVDAKSTGDFNIHSYDHTGDHTGDCLFEVELENAADDISAICVEVEASGYSDSEAIRVRYNTGDLQPGDLLSLLKMSLDDTEAASSDVTTDAKFIELLTLDQEALNKIGIHIGQSFDTALVVRGGTEEDPDHGYEVTPDVPVDRVNGVPPGGTAFLEASAADEIIFDADNDYILIGSDATFEAIDVILTNGANQPILEEYYYSTGAGTWAPLIVSDTVVGFTQSGTITFNAPAAWALSNLTVPAGAAINNAFYVKIVRTRNHLGAPPVEDYFKTFSTSSTTDFEIRGDGTIRPVHMADAAASNDSIYYSTNAAKLVYKDGGGVVRPLY